MGLLDQSSQRVMPDWMYNAGPKFNGLLESLSNAVNVGRTESLTPSTNPAITQAGQVAYPSVADLIIGNTPLGNIPMMEGLLKNGLPQLPPTFNNAMGSDAGRAASYGMAGIAGLSGLLPMMGRSAGVHPLLNPKTPGMDDFRAASPTAFGLQDPLLDAGMVDNYSLPRMLQQQAGNAGQYSRQVDDRSSRMAEQGYQPGYWRGGKSVADGDFYTPDKQAATDFAKRYGEGGDVREYALRLDNRFDGNSGYSNDVLQKMSRTLVDEYNIKPKMANEFATMADDFDGQMPGAVVVQILKNLTGSQDSALSVIGKHFDSANFGQEVVMFNRGKGGVRDSNKAKFDPKKKFDPSPFAGVAGAGLLYPVLSNDSKK